MKYRNGHFVVKDRGFFVAKTVAFILLTLYAITLIVPTIYAFFTSLKTQVEATTYNINGLPEQWLFSNYIRAFSVLKVDGKNMFVLLFNSLWLTIGGTAITLFFQALTAYLISRYKFPGRNFLFSLNIVMMMLPIMGSLPSYHKIVTALGIIDTPFWLITSISGFGGNFLIWYAYFKNISWQYAEAAFIDGAGHSKVFFKIMLPQTVPLMASLGILGFIGAWNDYNTPLLFLKSYPTLASGLYIFQVMQTREFDLPVLYAGLLMSAVPVLLLFSFFSGKIMNITVGGGLKG